MEKLVYGNIREHIEDHIHVLRKSIFQHNETLVNIADAISRCYRKGGKVLLFGNGGSYADALHWAGELEGFFRNRNRRGLAAKVLANPVTLTCVSNDAGYDLVFKREVETYAQKRDIVIGLSTSGNSPNVVLGLEAAKKIGAKTIGFTGKNGGKVKAVVDILVNAHSEDVARIQEVHEFMYHEICELVEERLKERRK